MEKRPRVGGLRIIVRNERVFENYQDVRKEFEARGVSLDGWAADMLGEIDFKPDRHETFKVVKVSVAQLGFRSGTRFDELCSKAASKGLELCLAQLVPNICFACKRRLTKPALIATRPIRVIKMPHIFRLECRSARIILGATLGHPEKICYADDEWLFTIRP